MIDIKNITKSFGSLQVLKGIDLHINKGEVVSIVGPSGAGKTTLLQIMGTLDNADSGSIMVDGVDVGKLSSSELSKFRNGHIGFNEPAEEFTYGTHVVTLAADTIEANARFFKSADEVPRQAVSMGIGNIMAAKCVVLVATGENKAKAVYDTIRGPITPRVPASVLQLHPCCVILTDREAGKLMLEE